MIDQGVTAALTARDANRNGDDSHTSGTGVRRNEHAARECTYPDFLKCKPLNFKGTEGVLPCNAMENVEEDNDRQVLPEGTGTNLAIGKFPEESDKVEKYVGGLPDIIYGSVMATKPKTMQDAIEFATELMDKKISTLAERQAENKGKLDNNNQTQQQISKRQNVAQAYAAGTGERNEYAGNLPLCNKCKFHHNGPCTVKCANCKRVGHLTRDCWSSAATNNQRTLTCYECRNQGHYKGDCQELKNGNEARGQSAINLAHQKSYADVRRKPIEFQVDNLVMLKVLEQVKPVAYKLKIPQELSMVYNTFHVYNLRKCYADEPLAVPLGGLHLDNEL
ncbi:putative reverse transcriptase domain-containing protein [Tanacetum coccineum]